jgi:hypothetical protein
MKKNLLYIYFIITSTILGLTLSCKTTYIPYEEEKITEEKDPFLDDEKVLDNELFRVKITPTEYKIRQLRHFDKIKRIEDKEGDEKIIEELKKYEGIIKTERIGLAELWFYPDTGKPMRIRIKKTTGLQEFDLLINEDLTRWRFKPIRSKKYPVMYVKYLIKIE